LERKRGGKEQDLSLSTKKGKRSRHIHDKGVKERTKNGKKKTVWTRKREEKRGSSLGGKGITEKASEETGQTAMIETLPNLHSQQRQSQKHQPEAP